MSKQSLLLVDGDTRSMRVLEVSLRKAGFTVTTAVSVQDALDKLELDAPDLIISETTFTDGDGFELRRRVRTRPEWGEIPFIFLTAEAAIENKIKGLELGVDDYLTKPIYIKEIITRINILLQKRQRTRFEERRDGRTRFAGRVADMPVVDVIQTIEISRKSGVIQFVGERNRQAAIYFRDGRVIDAEAGALQGEDAVYRLLTWSEGDFEVVFRTVRRREVISTSSQGLLMEGMRRLDEWSRLLEQLPPLSHRFEVEAEELASRLGDVPDDNNPILRLIDGRRTLLEVIDSSDVGDLECLQTISRLYFEEMLTDLDHGAPTRRDTGKTVPLVEVETPTPIEESASGPIDSGRLASTADLVAAMQRDVVPEPAPIDSHSGAFVRPSVEEIQSSQIESSEDAEPAPAPRESGEPIAAEDIQEVHEPGALEGRYRPSSLRLIDEAVAAAQAIEPSLFEDEESTAAPIDVLSAQQSDGTVETVEEHEVEEIADSNVTFVAVPEPVEEDEDDSSPLTATPIGREESGLKMIGSLGRDRAQTSGEVLLPGPAVGRTTTERELVTILPRRITRENPVVVSADTPTEEVTDAPLAKRIETPKRPPPPRVPMSGSGVRRQTGPGRGAMALLALAGVLAVVAIYLYVTRPAKRKGKVPADAGEVVGPVVTPIADAHAMTPDAPEPDAIVIAQIDAAVTDAMIKPDAAVDAKGEPSADPIERAKELYDQAYAALEDGSFDKALELVEQSLKLRRTARSYLLRAQAMQRLGRVDEALKSLDQAEQTFPIPAIYEARARILKAAGRNDEAREAILKYLELVPDRGPVVKLFKQWLEELH